VKEAGTRKVFDGWRGAAGDHHGMAWRARGRCSGFQETRTNASGSPHWRIPGGGGGTWRGSPESRRQRPSAVDTRRLASGRHLRAWGEGEESLGGARSHLERVGTVGEDGERHAATPSSARCAVPEAGKKTMATTGEAPPLD
jgi:hypothetical protein